MENQAKTHKQRTSKKRKEKLAKMQQTSLSTKTRRVHKDIFMVRMTYAIHRPKLLPPKFLSSNYNAQCFPI